MRDLNAVLVIAYRDVVKLLRDPGRLISSLIFPLVFIGVLGGSLQSNLGDALPYNFLVFTFTGVLAQTLFQSSATGVISLIEDRQNDFSQEIFVTPISRYSILIGKIFGESLVAMVQAIPIMLFGYVVFNFMMGISLTVGMLLALVPALLAACMLGGAFGVLVLSNLSSQRVANQVFPFIILPQFFLAGIFSPIQHLPLPLEILSRISPMRYAVDFVRNVYYAGSPEYPYVVLDPLAFNLALMAGMFVLFLGVGTFLFVRSERNR